MVVNSNQLAIPVTRCGDSHVTFLSCITIPAKPPALWSIKTHLRQFLLALVGTDISSLTYTTVQISVSMLLLAHSTTNEPKNIINSLSRCRRLLFGFSQLAHDADTRAPGATLNFSAEDTVRIDSPEIKSIFLRNQVEGLQYNKSRSQHRRRDLSIPRCHR